MMKRKGVCITAGAIIYAVALFLSTLAVSSPAGAADCPFLKSKEVAGALLDPPSNVTFEVFDLKGKDGMQRARICQFSAPVSGVGVAGVGVKVIDFTSAMSASSHFQKLRKDTGGKIFPGSGVGSAAFTAFIPGFSSNTYVLIGSHVLTVSHVMSPKVLEAIAKNPDAEVIGTHELAKIAAGRI